MNEPHDRERVRHEENPPTKGRKPPRGWRYGRGDTGEVWKYVLSKVAVSGEGELTEKPQRGMPPSCLTHPPWTTPLRLNVVTELGFNLLKGRFSRTGYKFL